MDSCFLSSSFLSPSLTSGDEILIGPLNPILFPLLFKEAYLKHPF
jgi:hypothetical protein